MSSVSLMHPRHCVPGQNMRKQRLSSVPREQGVPAALSAPVLGGNQSYTRQMNGCSVTELQLFAQDGCKCKSLTVFVKQVLFQVFPHVVKVNCARFLPVKILSFRIGSTN